MALPSIETETNAVDQTQTAIDKLGKSIMEKASMSIQGATKAIIPNIPKMINELTMDLEKGPINSFTKVIVKLEKMVESLGLDLRSYNEDLADMLQQREKKAVESEKTVADLRQQNIIARVNKETKEVEVLTRSQIRIEEKLMKKQTDRIAVLQKSIEKDRRAIQDKDKLSNQEKNVVRKRIVANTEALTNLEAKRDETAGTLNTTADTGRAKPLPMFVEQLKDAFMEPFAAISESFNMLKETGKGSAELVNFLTGGIFLKAFKGLTRGIKAIGGFFTLARLALVAKFALIIGAITFVATKIKSIVGFFQKIIDWFRNSYVGKLLGLSKETPEEKAEREQKSKDFGLNDGMELLDDHYKQDIPKAEMKSMDNTDATDIAPQGEGNEVKEKVKSFFRSLLEKASNVKDKAVEFASLNKEKATGGTVVINNAPTTVSQNQSGTVVSGYVDNKQDDTIINTSSNNWRDI